MKQTEHSTFEKIYQMPLSKVYPLLVNKATRKGRTQAEADEILRWLTGYTQEELARRANVSRATIAGLESGATVVTTTETLIKIADALGKKVSDIFLA